MTLSIPNSRFKKIHLRFVRVRVYGFNATFNNNSAIWSVEDPEGDVHLPLLREREREGGGAVFRPSIKHISIHSFTRLLNVINHYIFLPVALPF